MKIALEGFKTRRKNEETLLQSNWNYPYWEAQRKRKEKNVKILRDLYNTADHINMHTVGVPKENERNKGAKAYFKK